MITLRTGTPGACKTLSAVENLAKMLGRWDKHPEEARPIFVHGVKDLALPHAPMPVIEWREGGNKPPVMVPDWSSVPDGAFCLIDEAQSFFPPRSSAATPPPHVSFLNTHRHRGLDIEIVTQHPKLIDGSVRALVGKHIHFRRLFGGQRSYSYEWDSCSDGLAGLAGAVGALYTFPKKAFTWYKSAEIHTKQSFRLPKWLLIPVVGVLISVFAFPRAYQVFANGIGGKGLNNEIAKTATAPRPASSSAALAAVSASAPSRGIVKEIEQVITPPKIAGCMATPKRCSCLQVDGTAADVTETQCRVASETLGGLVPYDTTSRSGGSVSSALLGPAPDRADAKPAVIGMATGDFRNRAQRTIERGTGPGGMGAL